MLSVNVRFSVEFSYRPYNRNPFAATVSLTLPCNGDGYLLDCLQSYDGIILYGRAKESWGDPDSERISRTAKTEKCANSWEHLQQIVDEYITSTKNEIKALLNRYHTAVNTMPESYCVSCTISDDSVIFDDYGFTDEEG